MRLVTRPQVVLGYQRVHVGASQAAIRAGRRALEGFADGVGLRLLRVYVDADANRPCGGLLELIRAARETGTKIVAVPTRADLGGTPYVQTVTASIIQRETNAEVLVVDEIDTETGVPVRAEGSR